MNIGKLVSIFIKIITMNKDIQGCSNSVVVHENEIKLLFNSPALKDKILLIIEGKSDFKIYKSLFDDKNVYLHKNGSCDGLVPLLEHLNLEYMDCCLAIKDADFDNLEGKKYPQLQNLFLTDFHDIEMMMIDDEAENKICSEFLDKKEIDIFKKCINDIIYISYIKWLNISKKLCLCVDVFSRLGDIYDGNTPVKLSSCKEKLKRVENNVAKCCDFEKNIESFISENQTSDFLNLTNGHDFCNALAIFIKAHNGENISGSNLERFIRATYSFEKFKKSKLFAHIKEWETAHCRKLFK